MASSPLNMETILVVEDEAELRGIIALILRGESYFVLEATDGDDALSVAGDYAAPIALIVSDVNMPNMNGWALLEQLRRWYPRIRFLMVSGYQQPIAPTEAGEQTVTAFLGKPFTPGQLVDAVRALLDG